MDNYRIELTIEEFGRLNSLYPASESSALIGKRAEEIVKIHFRRRDPHCAFEVPGTGPDLKVALSDGSEPILIEVKGTASAGIAWPQLKVSSRHSWRSLTETRIPVYRVSEVFAETPCIHVLIYGTDFTLDQEDRWTFKRVRSQDESPSVVQQGQVDPRTAELVRQSKGMIRCAVTSKARLRRKSLSHSRMLPRFSDFRCRHPASKYQAFWANQSDASNRPWAKAWQDAGFSVDSFRLDRDGWVRFKRRSASH
jgi:hypothetical protein